MTPRSSTPHFSGGDESTSHREETNRIALNLHQANPDLGHGFIHSATSYLLRDGRAPKDGAVLEEARRRKANRDRAVAGHRAWREGERREAA